MKELDPGQKGKTFQERLTLDRRRQGHFPCRSGRTLGRLGKLSRKVEGSRELKKFHFGLDVFSLFQGREAD